MRKTQSAQEPSRLARLPCVVLAGGAGKRLRSVFAQGPKCMAPIAGRPFLDYLLGWLRSAGITSVILCVGHKRVGIFKWIARQGNQGLKLAYAEEDRPLGTAGAIKNAEPLIRGRRLLVVNGDSLLEIDLGALVRFHRRRRALATVALAQVNAPASRYGQVQLGPGGTIRVFMEKGRSRLPGSTRTASRRYINAGIYVLEKTVLERIPPGRAVSLERDLLPRLVGQRLYGFPVRGFFIDIGVPEDYKKAQRELPQQFPR